MTAPLAGRTVVLVLLVAGLVGGLVGAITWAAWSLQQEDVLCNGVAPPPPGTCYTGIEIPLAAFVSAGLAALAVAAVGIGVAALWGRRDTYAG